jgi:hypothetical protein
MNLQSATLTALSLARNLGLDAEDAVVLQDSNRATLRLLPCDTVARVAPGSYQASAEFEVEVARRLAARGAPVAALEPRVEPRAYTAGGLVMNFWTYHPPVPGLELPAPAYADALRRLHEGMGRVDAHSPHFTDRVAEALRLVDDGRLSPALNTRDREFLGHSLRRLQDAVLARGAPEQLLHGEPHPGNLLITAQGPRFIDLETCCRGPVEFDIAHAPVEVAEHYPGADQDLVRECRLLMTAMVAAWRWDKDDKFPEGRQMGEGFINELRGSQAGR